MLEYLAMLLVISLVLIAIFSLVKDRVPLRPRVFYGTVGVSFALGAVFPAAISNLTMGGVLAIYFGLIAISATALSYAESRAPLNVSPDPVKVADLHAGEPASTAPVTAGEFTPPASCATADLPHEAQALEACAAEDYPDEAEPSAKASPAMQPAAGLPACGQEGPAKAQMAAAPDDAGTVGEQDSGVSSPGKEVSWEGTAFPEEEPAPEEAVCGIVDDTTDYIEKVFDETKEESPLEEPEPTPQEEPVPGAGENEGEQSGGPLPAGAAAGEGQPVFVRETPETSFQKDQAAPEAGAPEGAPPASDAIDENPAAPETVNNYISAGFKARAEGELALALEHFFKALQASLDYQVSAGLALEISAIYQELGQYSQAGLMLRSAVAQENVAGSPVLKQKLLGQSIYLDILAQLLKTAGMPNAPYSKIPNLIKIKANLEAAERLKELTKGGGVGEKQSADFRATGSQH